MLRGSAPKLEGRRGSQRRLEEGGRYLGIPGNGRFGTSPTWASETDARHSVLAQCPGNRVRYKVSALWCYAVSGVDARVRVGV